jgi:phage-related protein
MTIEGTVKEFQWTNPHTWVQVMVVDKATGEQAEGSVEGGSPNGLSPQG